MKTSQQKKFRSIHDQQEIQEDQEARYIKQLQVLQKKFNQDNTQKLKNILKTTYQIQQTATDTNVRLKGQTQKLQNINSMNHKMGKTLKKADQTTKQMSSFWYSLGKSIKGIFVSDKDQSQQQQFTVNNNSKAKPTYKQSKKYYNENQYKPQNNRKNLQDDGFVHQKVSTSKKSHDQIQDEYLDQISNQTRKLISFAKNINQQLQTQSTLINKANNCIDNNSKKIKQVDKRIKKNFF